MTADGPRKRSPGETNAQHDDCAVDPNIQFIEAGSRGGLGLGTTDNGGYQPFSSASCGLWPVAATSGATTDLGCRSTRQTADGFLPLPGHVRDRLPPGTLVRLDEVGDHFELRSEEP